MRDIADNAAGVSVKQQSINHLFRKGMIWTQTKQHYSHTTPQKNQQKTRKTHKGGHGLRNSTYCHVNAVRSEFLILKTCNERVLA